MTEQLTESWFDPSQTTFGDRIAGARESAGMTQEQLAMRLGVKLATLRKWEDDHSEPRANKLSTMSGLLGVSLTWLLNGEGPGIGAPNAQSQPDQMAGLLDEVRHLQQMSAEISERMGRIEPRLRVLLQAGASPL